MEMYHLLIFLFPLIIIALFFPKKLMPPQKQKQQMKKKRPPSPPSYPIIGHIHLLKPPVHRALQTLSYTYGPIFSLTFGSVPALVISSPQLLEECLNKNDVIFANRPHVLLGKHIGYNNTSVAFSNYGSHWRNLRRVLTIEFLCTNRLNEYITVRKQERESLLKNIFRDSILNTYKRVEMKSRLQELAFNNVMRMAAGDQFFGAGIEELESSKKFRELIRDIFEMSGGGPPNDFFTFLKWIDFQGFEKKMARLQKQSDSFLQGLVDRIRIERKATGKNEQNNKTLVDAMLAMQESEPEYYTDDIIKGTVSTALLAGTDSSASTTEWTMSLLLNHPEILEKVREEIDRKIGHDRLVDESDLSKLSYLQCVINETLRLFPAGPLLIPHMSSEDCIVGGFEIPRGTMLVANVWALHRDPSVWDDPTSFKPERFENVKIDGYKYMPFGMGRRQCPGGPLANRVVNLSLAALIQCFEWKRVVEEEYVDLSEGQGITMPKKKPLEAMCKPRQVMIDVLSNL